MTTSFTRSHARTAALSAPNPAAGHHSPMPLRRCLDNQGQVWVSLLGNHSSFLLGPDAHVVFFVPSKSLFPQSCVSSGGSMVGLMVASSKRAYTIPKSTAPRAPVNLAGHSDPYLRRRYSNTQRQVWLSLCGVSWCIQSFVSALQASLVGMGFDCKRDFAPPNNLLGLPLCPWTWCVFFW